MIYGLSLFILLFFTYSFLGYLLEVIDVSIIDRKINLSRGYLIGPYLPIYAFGAMLMTSTLDKYKNDLIVLFVMSLVMCCMLEFITSYIMEKIFKLRWWDYTDRLFNINGRVCLSNGVGFGIAGVITVRLINPFFLDVFSSLPNIVVIILGAVFACVLIVDFILSTFTILKLKIDTSKYINKDSTAKIRKEVLNSLNKYRIFHNRLFKAFPNLLNVDSIGQIKEIINKYKNKITKNN